MKEIKTISIKCETKETLNIAEMKVLQGNLKARNDIDYDKIKLSIIKYGFSFPFFLWKDGENNWLLDGTGRHETLYKMQKDGYLIPDLPVVFIDCKDRKEAKQKLLRLNSQYGKMSKESVLEFAEDIELDFDEIALPDTVIDFSDGEEDIPTELDEAEGKENPYKVGITFKSEEDKEAIKYACLHFHYAKRLPASSIAYNVYNDKNEWCGVIIYGRGANPNAGTRYKLCNGEYLELVRVALNGKQECTSKAVAISLRLLKKENPILKLVISYADIDQNHYGTIYQATNWIYCGESKTGGIRAYLINGKEVHTKTAKDKVYKYFKEFSMDNLKKVYKTNYISEVGTKGKRLYLMPLTKEMREEIEKYRKPYPKKEVEEDIKKGLQN